MVTFAQAQERAERWVNGGVPEEPGRRRFEVRVREFDLGFVAWAEASEEYSDGGADQGVGRQRLVIARDSGDTTLWPALPVGEVIRRYEEEYGNSGSVPASSGVPPQRLDLEATSFLLTPPGWLQEAADQMGIPDRRSPGSGTAGQNAAAAAAPQAPAAEGVSPWDAADTSSSGGGEAQSPPATVFAPPLSGSDDEYSGGDDERWEAKTEMMPETRPLPSTAVNPAVDEPGAGSGPSAPPPPSQPPNVPAPPAGSAPGQGTGAGSGGVHHAATMLAGPASGGPDGTPPPPPAPPGAPGSAGDFADADTSRAARGDNPSRGGGPSVPPPPGAPGTPGARSDGSGASGPSGGGYVPTQLVSSAEVEGQLGENGQPAGGSGGGEGSSGGSGPASGQGGGQGQGPGSGGVHHAATMLAGPSQGGPGGPPPPPPVPGTPPPAPGAPAAPGTPPPAPGTPPPAPGTPPPPGGGGAGGGDVHHAATMLAGPAQSGGPAAPAPPGPPPGVPGAPPGVPAAPGGGVSPQAYGFPQGAPGPQPGGPPPAYGYPQQQQQQPSGQPTVGPGYMAVLSYRAPDGSEQQLIRRSAPGTPHPEWQILHELRNMNVPPQQVVELHTELESCDLPGGYCARMVRETWPQVRITHTAPYGRDHASRQQGVRHLLEHQGELHQVADGPARPAPFRVPLPPQHQIPPMPPLPPDAVGQELAQAFGPQGVFRFEQHAVSRQGVPDIVGQTLMWAGVPVDVNPFFWGQAQPGRPVPTLAELAQERGVLPASDAGSYLVMGNDFGRQLCVQYGTAHIVAVPLEGSPEGRAAQPQFVNTGLPEFVRCMAALGRMWPLRFGLTQEQAGRWTVDFQLQLAALDPAALSSPENWWAVLLEQMWDGLF